MQSLHGEEDIMPVLRTLVARVARAFYDPKAIVVLDLLNTEVAPRSGIKDEAIALHLKLRPSEILKICGRIREDRLICSTTWQEPKTDTGRQNPRTYYYIDYKQFVDVVKYRMYTMQNIVTGRLRSESDNKGYVCPTCGKTYTTLDAVGVLDPMTQTFICDVCSSELVENESNASVVDSQDQLARLRAQTNPIIELLKRTDGKSIPVEYSTVSAKTQTTTSTDGTVSTNGHRAFGDIGYAQDTGMKSGEIKVQIQTDSEASRKSKQAEDEKARKANALPVWHQVSTIAGTGDRPTNGASEDEAEDEQFHPVADEEFEDHADYYNQYYERMMNGELGNGVGEAESTDDPESLKRSAEDDADEDARKRHHVDVDGVPTAIAEAGEEANLDIPMVSVNGEQVRLDEVTEDHQNIMTPDEYNAYYTAFSQFYGEE
ncbi:hypothetical protein BZG36_04068 [Bifiguratus adelaidae]|uniref:HTH TFE/IIEalpha-type domain-containing protein n=1 Tax=Bifiguratus adelaidae TaxID=1938954 RepID=A0A261XXT4_9FUNG|nr:hypothetical protein BZG36_04068 [Bifiguratus adelaidae]